MSLYTFLSTEFAFDNHVANYACYKHLSCRTYVKFPLLVCEFLISFD